MAETSDEQSPAAHGLGVALARLGSPPTLALLGAATPATQHEVVDRLSLRTPLTLVGAPIRDNVALDVVEARGEVRQRALVQLVLRLRRPGIIFAPTARDVDAIFGALTALRLPVHRYHPHLPPGDRVGEQLNFVLPGRRAIMVATSALFSPSGVVGVGEARELDRAPLDFGLGLEKRDIRFMIHWSTPASLEQYSRELALLGRDGEPSTAVMFHDQSDRSRNEMLLTQMRLGARHLTQLVKTLEPSAIDGHPRTLEALALASGLSRKTSEALAAILDDAGLVQYSAGWVRPLLPARLLAERGHDLTARLERLRAQDSRRLSELSAFLESKGCLRQSLESYFGDSRGKCGQCSSCRGSLLPTTSTPDAQERVGARRPPVETFSVGRGQSYALEVLPPARQARPLTVKLADFQRGR